MSSTKDPYLAPSLGWKSKSGRAGWALVYLLFFRFSPRPFFGWRAFLLKAFGARIGLKNFIYPKAIIWAPWLLETSDVVTIADGVEVYNPGGVFLRHHSIVSQGALLCGASHDFNSTDFPMVWKPIVLEPYAWVCARAIVLPGVTIGAGAVLGAGAITSRDLEPMGVYAGNPARRVGTRTAELSLD